MKEISVINCEAATLPLPGEIRSDGGSKQNIILSLRRYITAHANPSSALMVLNFEAADKNLQLEAGSAKRHLREAALSERYSVETESPVIILLRRELCADSY